MVYEIVFDLHKVCKGDGKDDCYDLLLRCLLKASNKEQFPRELARTERESVIELDTYILQPVQLY